MGVTKSTLIHGFFHIYEYILDPPTAQSIYGNLSLFILPSETDTFRILSEASGWVRDGKNDPFTKYHGHPTVDG